MFCPCAGQLQRRRTTRRVAMYRRGVRAHLIGLPSSLLGQGGVALAPRDLFAVECGAGLTPASHAECMHAWHTRMPRIIIIFPSRGGLLKTHPTVPGTSMTCWCGDMRGNTSVRYIAATCAASSTGIVTLSVVVGTIVASDPKRVVRYSNR